jgi:hypothetical protein
MDTVLETFDTYCLDWFYAVALPPKESTVIALQSHPSSYGSGSACCCTTVSQLGRISYRTRVTKRQIASVSEELQAYRAHKSRRGELV